LKENRRVSDDAKFDELIDREAKGYRAGAEPPADLMWSRIESDVARAIRRPEAGIGRHWRWLAAGAGIAATLVVGVAIGRHTRVDDAARQPTAVAVASTDSSVSAAHDVQMRAVTMSHLGEAEVLLTEVRADLTSGRNDALRGERSRQLLARTRLLLANGAAPTPAVERLLEDLELVLAEIAALPDSGRRRTIDARLLDERLRGGTVLPRIRTILPSPTAANAL
jgi:hypothetical protein